MLFLGVYHHLARQMPVADLHSLLELFLQKAGTWFVARSKAIPAFESIVLANGFELACSSPGIKGRVGPLCTYRRFEAAS